MRMRSLASQGYNILATGAGGVDPSNGDSPPITWEKTWRQIPNLGEAVGKKFVNSRRLISRFYFATVWGNIVNKERKNGI